MSGGGMLSHDWFPQVLPDNVVIGERSWCYSSYAFLHYRSRRPCGVKVGDDTGIYHGTFFDLGPEGEVEIGNFCTLVGAIISTNGRVVIEDYTFVAHEVVLADSFAAKPLPPDMADPRPPPPPILLSQNSWIGARAVIMSGTAIGKNAVIGAGSVVNFDVPPNAIVAGNPARIVGWAKDRG